jgi:hypothetical protein
MRMSPEEFIDFERKRQSKQPPAAQTATQRMQAKGRLPPGQMNKSEAAYALILDARKHAGEVLWWVFESIKLKLADRTYLTIDFALMLADGSIEFHDVKGARAIIQEDAAVKMKVAAAKFPFPMFYAFPPKRVGGTWTIEAV